MGRPKSSRFGSPFLSKHRAGLVPKEVSFFRTETELHTRAIHFRPGKGLTDIHSWKYIKTQSSTSFFVLPNGLKVAVKPQLETFPKIGLLGRSPRRLARDMIPVLKELVRRRVRIERPLGLIEMKDGSSFYVVREEKGETLHQAMALAPPRKKRQIVVSLATALADIHNKGVVHFHPHNLNWLVDGVNARLVDAKSVFFKEDFPHTFRVSGRILTWEKVTQNDCVATEEGIPEAMHPLFREVYRLARKSS